MSYITHFFAQRLVARRCLWSPFEKTKILYLFNMSLLKYSKLLAAW